MILKANSLHIPLKDESVHCVVTSPPYYGLRVFDIPDVLFGGSEECMHEWVEMVKPAQNGMIYSEMRDRREGGSLNHMSATRRSNRSRVCLHCKGWLGQLGLEPRINMYIDHLVQIFREVRRVLRRDGTVWLNIADSYASGKGSCYNPGGGERSLGKHLKIAGVHFLNRSNISDLKEMKLKPKDLCLIPARFSIALQEDGWWVRSNIIWAKQAPMCESVNDRPTKSHEYIFLLTKSSRYFYDNVAIKEAQIEYERIRRLREKKRGLNTVYHLASDGETGQHPQSEKVCVRNIRARQDLAVSGLRNCRDVWLLGPQPSNIPHYATYPDEIPLRAVKAGTSEKGVCPKCGSPWVRIVKRTGGTIGKGWVSHKDDIGVGMRQHSQESRGIADGWESGNYQTKTLGWKHTCSCGEPETVPAIVLDPFAGSGTSLRVAQELGRRSVGIDLGYQFLQKEKLSRAQVKLPMVEGIYGRSR